MNRSIDMEERLPNIHPGEILLEEFLNPMNISAYRLAKETHLAQTRISPIIKGKRSITADTALRFAKFFGNSAEFWMGLQDDFDLENEKYKIEDELNSINSVAESGLNNAQPNT
jgi:antitoxin HigA-1